MYYNFYILKCKVEIVRDYFFISCLAATSDIFKSISFSFLKASTTTKKYASTYEQI